LKNVKDFVAKFGTKLKVGYGDNYGR